jgi:hypothetical protein
VATLNGSAGSSRAPQPPPSLNICSGLLTRRPSEHLPYSPGLVPGEEGGGANVNMAGVSLRSRDHPYLRFPGAVRALVFQTMGWRSRMAMKKEEARRAVLSEYDGWAKKHPNAANMMGGFLFFRYLQQERSDLLDFHGAGNKWEIVHGWIRDRLQD